MHVCKPNSRERDTPLPFSLGFFEERFAGKRIYCSEAQASIRQRKRRTKIAQIIPNQASIRYRYGETEAAAVSNIASTTLAQPLSVSKTSLETTYREGDELTYIVTVTNGGTAALSDVTVTDTLGTFTDGTVTATPLTFVPDALLFIDGVNSGVITPTAGTDSITFTIPAIPAQGTAIIVYKVQANAFAPLTADAQITNTVTADADGVSEAVSASYTVTAEEYADVNIFKSMNAEGETITYTFEVTNRGNAPAENIVLTDAFEPAPASITVSIDGTVIPATEYTYTCGVLTLPNGTGTPLTLPAATVVTDPVTGETVVTPSVLTITVTGTL